MPFRVEGEAVRRVRGHRPLLAHERGDNASPAVLPQLQREILEVIRRHLRIDSEAVDIRMDRSDERSTLEINIDLPSSPILSATVRR